MPKLNKVVFLSQLFDPEYSIKGIQLIKSLRAEGYDIEVVTAAPSYPHGRVTKGYKNKLYQKDVMDGVTVHRLWSFISPRKNKLFRALNYLSFFFTSTLFPLWRSKPDLLYAYHPQITAGVTGLLLKKSARVPFITDVQDLWPESLVSDGLDPSSKISKIMTAVCRRIFEQAESIVVLSKGFKAAIVERGIDETKIDVVYNWCAEEARFTALTPPDVSDQHRPLQFFYTGNHGPLQSLGTVVEAFSRFDSDKVQLTLVGAGSEKSKINKMIKDQSLTNVTSIDFLSPGELSAKLRQADVLVCHLKDDPLFKITIPSKTQAYLCSAKPVLMAVGGEASDIVIEAKAGVSAIPQNVESLVGAINELCRRRNELYDMGAAGRAYYQQNLGFARAVSQLKVVLEKAL